MSTFPVRPIPSVVPSSTRKRTGVERTGAVGKCEGAAEVEGAPSGVVDTGNDLGPSVRTASGHEIFYLETGWRLASGADVQVYANACPSRDFNYASTRIATVRLHLPPRQRPDGASGTQPCCSSGLRNSGM